MTRHWLLLAPFLLLAGCGGTPISPPEAPEPEERPVLLEATSNVSLAELLTKPRAELAELAEEWTARVRLQEKAHRAGEGSFSLLPEVRLPLVLPVWRECKFSSRAGISLPPYLPEGTRDSLCALHLARYGDTEAARQLLEPGDTATPRRLDALAAERNYPVEWTRLVALQLHAAQRSLACGEVEGGGELVALHRQLVKLLDPKAANGPLGAELLARGQYTLSQAAHVWREHKNNGLARQADKVLADWGKVPALALAVTPGEKRTETARVLGGPGQERLAVAASTLRALDLFALPFPADGVQGVFAFFDTSDRLADVLLTYRPRIGESYPEPGQLAQRLEESSLKGVAAPRTSGLRSRAYTIGNLVCDVGIAAHASSVGACVHVRNPNQPAAYPELARDFGAVHFERTFEQGRLQVASEQLADAVQVDRPRTLALIRDPLRPAEKPKTFTLAGATLQRETGQDLLARLTLRYQFDQHAPPLPEIARPLWTAFGPGRLEEIQSGEGNHLALVWQGGPTRCALVLPNAGDHAFQLQVQDRRGPEQLAARQAAALAFDRAERQARLKAGKPQLRLPRQVAVEWTMHPQPVELGMTRDQVLQALPGGASVLKQETPGEVRVTFTAAPAKSATHVLRQLFIRFSATGKVTEVRARYADGPAGTAQGLLSVYRKNGGMTAEQPGSWVGVWSDLPPRKPAATLSRWSDDATQLSLQRDSGGVEVTLRDGLIESASPPLEYLPRGPEGVSLGDMREAVLRRFNVGTTSNRPDGSVALSPPKAGQYDGYLAWFDKDRVVKIVARHSKEGAGSQRPSEMPQLLMKEWGRNGQALGWPRRQDLLNDGALHSLGWNDDRTRVRLFWQENNDGRARAYTEWKELSP